ncbi:TPA: transcriptional regulator [Acinetobacter baumannii]|nr:transcriptional regulator [Acinetobacter baumannii]HCA5278772.1 transcriptional regulator [Acinetobacter baumannii]HCA5290677.1 transcriptional regulator [Acinetobacter baumannii]HCA5302833.1 transcriptional regulator [Acinetobacter baumannii]
MSKLSVDISASARNGVSRILHGLDISNQKEIAEHLKVDPSTITRLKTDKKNNGLNEIEMFCELLSLLGLKVVPKDYQSIDKEHVAALLVMSKSWMNRIETVDDLFHDEISGQKEKLGY